MNPKMNRSHLIWIWDSAEMSLEHPLARPIVWRVAFSWKCGLHGRRPSQMPPGVAVLGCKGARQVMGKPSMSKAMEQIVDEYVRLNHRQGLEDLRRHLQKLAVDLKGRPGYDFSMTIGQISQEIAVIDAGFNRLNAGAWAGAHRRSGIFKAPPHRRPS
jgi:hypothetical protein